MHHQYEKLEDSNTNCCFPQKNSEPSAEEKIFETIEYAQKLIRTLNVKSAGLWQKYNRLREEARTLAVKEGDKDGARSLLQQARAIRANRLQKLNLITNLEQMVLRVQDAHTLVATGQSMQMGTHAMNSMVSEKTMEQVDELMEQCREAIERVDDVGSVMSEQIEVVDIEEELSLLMDTPDDEVVLPDVPSKRIESKTSTTSNRKQALLI